MAGIADQLKLWAKGRKPMPKGKPAEGGGEDKEASAKASSKPKEGTSEAPPPKAPGKGEEDSDEPTGPKPPFAKETTPGNPGMTKPKPNPFEAFAKKGKGKLPPFTKKGEPKKDAPFGGKKAPPFTKEDGG